MLKTEEFADYDSLKVVKKAKTFCGPDMSFKKFCYTCIRFVA